ncbi:MAG: hypothetical protein K2F59_03695 [Eubacteriales bacterium]|nr:hypothetical protein [Eubacteriales bacterium]
MYLFSKDRRGAINLSYAQSFAIDESPDKDAWAIWAFRADNRFIVLNEFETLEEAKQFLEAIIEIATQGKKECIYQEDVYKYVQSKKRWATYKST